jgi:hypothetical protein
MGTGSHRSMGPRGPGGVPIFRAALAWAICGFLLAGCESLNDLNDSLKESGVWPFNADETAEAAEGASGAGDEPVTAGAGDEVALDAALVDKVQTQLAGLGYQPGPVDGAMGPKTRAAIRRYQVVVGLPVDGRITESFLARLEESAEAGPPAQAVAEAESLAEAEIGISPAALQPAPAYDAGTRYVYADGEVRKVLKVDGARVYWESNKSGQSVAYDNFLIPPLSWVSSETSGKRTVDIAPRAFWPQEGGRELALSATTMVEHRSRPDSRSELNESWRCRDDGAARLSLRAGVFQTRKLVCDGASEPDGAHLQRVWHYAPEIGHYVQFEEIDGAQGVSRRSELVAIVPSTEKWPPAARAGLGWALEHALETAAPGEETDWTSSAIDIRVSITPGPRAASDENGACRNYAQTWSGPEGSRVYPGLACRQPDGQWLIPGLGADVEVAEGAD